MQGYRDDELATRWVQLGVFSPILRLHSANNPWNAKEPWRFIPEARSAMNEALRLRHRLIPYIYSMNVRSARDGEPLVQPIYWKYPKIGSSFHYRNTYFFGDQLFVVPMTSPRDKVTRRTGVECWVPPGRHVDIFSGQIYDGNRTLKIFRQLDEYAVLAPEGAIIPFDAADSPRSHSANPEDLEIKVIVGADGEFMLYEDNGMGAGLDTVEWATTPIKYEQKSGTVTIGPASGDLKALPQKRNWKVTFVSLERNATITSSSDGQQAGECEAETSTAGTSVSVTSVPVASTVTITVKSNKSSGPVLRIRDAMDDDVYSLIAHAQMEFDKKSAVWEIINDREKPLLVRLAGLRGLKIDENLEAALAECLGADSRWHG